MRYWYGLLTEGGLDEEYERIAFDAQRLEAALRSGELVPDTLLRDRLLALGSGGSRASGQIQPRQQS